MHKRHIIFNAESLLQADMEPLPKCARLSTEDVLEELEFDVDEPIMLGSDEEFEFFDEEGTSEEEDSICQAGLG